MKSMTVLGDVFGCCFINYEINCVVLCIRPEWPLDFGFTRRN